MAIGLIDFDGSKKAYIPICEYGQGLTFDALPNLPIDSG